MVALVLLMPTWSGEAHEIPSDVTLQAFVKPEAGTELPWAGAVIVGTGRSTPGGPVTPIRHARPMRG